VEGKARRSRPEDLSGNLVVQLGLATEALNRAWYERNTGRAVADVQRWVQHPVKRWMAATIDGMVEGVDAVFEAKFMLPRSFSEEAAGGKTHGPAAAQHVGDQRQVGGAVDHHRRRQVDRDDDTCRRSLPALSGDGGAPVLALRSDWRDPASLWRRASPATRSKRVESSI
jgi:hypothetical protein